MDVVIRVGDRAKLKPHGVLCPHMTFDGPTASCGVHSEPWFVETPCHVYGNPDIDVDFEMKRGKPCPVGAMIQKRGGLPILQGALAMEHQTIKAELLEDLGQWQTEPY